MSRLIDKKIQFFIISIPPLQRIMESKEVAEGAPDKDKDKKGKRELLGKYRLILWHALKGGARSYLLTYLLKGGVNLVANKNLTAVAQTPPSI